MSNKSWYKDIAGQTFGRLTALRRVGMRHHLSLWECRCSCGVIKVLPITYLTTGDTTSCGCYRRENLRRLYVKDLRGQSFGRLVVLDRAGLTVHQKTLWQCKCACGNIVTVISSKLVSGWTKSCGCILVEKFKKFYPSVSSTLLLDKIQVTFNIQIEREYYLERRFFDGRVKTVLFEVDSTYWHKNSQENDILKDSIALRNGFTIVRLELEKHEDVQRQFELYENSLRKVFLLKGII